MDLFIDDSTQVASDYKLKTKLYNSLSLIISNYK